MASPLASRDPKLAKPASSPSSPTATGSPTTASDKSSSAETQLDKDTILALQKELLDIFTAPGVQKKLREIRDSGVKCPTFAALLDTKEQRKLLEKYGLDASLSDLKEVTYIWRNFETDPDVYVNHASIQEALGFSTVKDQDVQMPKGYKQPLNKQSLIRLMKSLLKSYSEPDFQAAIEDMKRRADASKEGSKIQKDGYYHLPGREAVAFAVQEQLLPCFGLQATRNVSMQAPLQAPDVGRETMLTDIWETPEVLRGLLQVYMKDGVVELPGLRDKLPPEHGLAGRTPLEIMAASSEKRMAEGFTNRFSIIGSGTSWHATLLAEYLIEYMARIPVEAHYASEFRYHEPSLQTGDVVFVVSMSGETADAVESLRQITKSALGKNVLKIAVVNSSSSTLAEESDLVINVQAGAEVGVASTKGFSATGFVFELLSLALADECGTITDAERSIFVKRLHELPEGMQEVLDREAKPLMQTSTDNPIGIGECPLWDIGCQNVLAQNFIFLGRGCNFPVALEGAMKCKELAYIHAEGYPAAEMKHGPIALIDEFMPVVVVCPMADATYEKIKSNIEEVKARNGATIAITEKYNDELEQLCEYVIGLAETHEYLMPILAMVPLQLLAYMMGILRNNTVDHPRGLVKSISVKIEETGSGYAA